MKKLIYTAVFLLASLSMLAQTDGISYQAVIISPDVQELPGVDAQGNILPNAAIGIRFSIFDEFNSIEFQEVHYTNTDAYGRINLVIGSVNVEDFTAIGWNGTIKNLLVEIDFDGGDQYLELSKQELLFVPYAYHRNITATGTLKVEGATELYSELSVDGITDLNNILNVNNNSPTNLSGQLNVQEATALSSSLTVEGVTTLNDSLFVNAPMELNDNLTVDGVTRLNDSLYVGGPATLENKLFVGGSTELDNSLKVNNNTLLEGNLTVLAGGTSRFFGKLRVDSTSTFHDNITVLQQATSTFLGPVNFSGPSSFSAISVGGTSTLNGRVTITDNAGDDESLISSYPLLVKGGKQGIAIKVNGGRSTDNNFISFWDESTGQMWGRIEGLTLGEQLTDPSFLLEAGSKTFGVVTNAIGLGHYISDTFFTTIDLTLTVTDVRPCLGLGACAVPPSVFRITAKATWSILTIAETVIEVGKLGLAIAEDVAFIGSRVNNIGVSYQSGSGDYAEWIPKQISTDIFVPGELVGINNGQVSKNTWGAEKVMIVSTNPIVLGNMPQPDQEDKSVMIAFMGQVPVKVFGKVEAGDYIVPNLFAEGFASAIHPKDMKTNDYKNVAGVAWNVIEKMSEELSIVNAAVGLNTNDLSTVLIQQEKEIQKLKGETLQLDQQLARSMEILSELVPGYSEAIGIDKQENHTNSVGRLHAESEDKAYERPKPGDIASLDENDIVYFEISDEQIEASIDLARDFYVNMLEGKADFTSLIGAKDEAVKKQLEDMVLMPIEEHPFWQRIENDPDYRTEVVRFVQSNIEKSFHTHKKYVDKFTDFKVRE